MSSLAVLIVNPAAGSFKEKDIRLLEQMVEKKGLHVEVLFSKKRGDIQELAERSKDEKPEIIFAVGGDGTFNEAVNGLVHTDIPLSFIPTGTTNVVAKELDIPEKVEKAVRKAMRGKARRMTLGKLTDAKGSPRYFIMMAGAGFDAYSVYRMNPKLKGVLGRGAYIVSGFKRLLTYCPEPITVKFEDTERVGYSVVVSNGSCYGGKFRITPDASLFDSQLYVFILKDRTRVSLVKTALSLLGSRHLKLKASDYFSTESLSLHGSSYLQVDGEYTGKLPVDVCTEPECLSILY